MNELEARANVAKCDEDLRIATKHREEAAARTMTPENKRAYERALEWEQTCRSARTVAGCELRNVIGAGSEPAPLAGEIEGAPAADVRNAERIRKTRQLSAELALLTEYDRTRSRSGHDYGSGQRHAELIRRQRELLARGATVEEELGLGVTKEELAAAFERVGRPKLRRAESESFRRGTPATQRTLRAWAMVERWSTGARDAQLEDDLAKAEKIKRQLVEPPATTEQAIAGIIRRGDGGSAIRRAIERSNELDVEQRDELDHGLGEIDGSGA